MHTLKKKLIFFICSFYTLWATQFAKRNRIYNTLFGIFSLQYILFKNERKKTQITFYPLYRSMAYSIDENQVQFYHIMIFKKRREFK